MKSIPFLFQIQTHLSDMYTHHSTAEQGLHNALKVVNALQEIGIDYDIQVWQYINNTRNSF